MNSVAHEIWKCLRHVSFEFSRFLISFLVGKGALMKNYSDDLIEMLKKRRRKLFESLLTLKNFSNNRSKKKFFWNFLLDFFHGFVRSNCFETFCWTEWSLNVNFFPFQSKLSWFERMKKTLDFPSLDTFTSFNATFLVSCVETNRLASVRDIKALSRTWNCCRFSFVDFKIDKQAT